MTNDAGFVGLGGVFFLASIFVFVSAWFRHRRACLVHELAVKKYDEALAHYRKTEEILLEWSGSSRYNVPANDNERRK